MKHMYKIIIGFLLLFTLGATSSTRYKTPSTDDLDRKVEYRISTSVHEMKGAIWVFETKYDITTGNIISRKQVHSKKYGNIK